MLGVLLITITIVLSILLAVLLMTKLWGKVSFYLHAHYTYAKVLFVVIYSAKQVLLIISSLLFKGQFELYQIFVSLFALMVLTTVSLQSMMLEAVNTNNINRLNEYTKNFAEQRFKIRQNYENQMTSLKAQILRLEEEKSKTKFGRSEGSYRRVIPKGQEERPQLIYTGPAAGRTRRLKTAEVKAIEKKVEGEFVAYHPTLGKEVGKTKVGAAVIEAKERLSKGQATWIKKYVSPKLAGRPTKTITLKEQIRLARMKNRIEKMKLQNSLNRLKMNRRVEILRRQGKIPELPYNRPMMPYQTIGETHIEPSVNNEINSAFNADMGYGDDMWGKENYYLDSDYYGEDYFGGETMWTGLGLHGLNLGRWERRPPSPLLY